MSFPGDGFASRVLNGSNKVSAHFIDSGQKPKFEHINLDSH